MRCFGEGDPLYERYHDEEWGRPLAEEAAVFERISLEAFQSGLSWITILRKREAFRLAFHGFDPRRVAAMGERDVTELLADEGIVRNRAKVEATISNARTLVRLREEGWRLPETLWSAVDLDLSPPATFSEVPPFTDAAKRIAADLKRRGFRFIGPTTTYAAMQALGVVNDHLAGCPVRADVETERARFFERDRRSVPPSLDA